MDRETGARLFVADGKQRLEAGSEHRDGGVQRIDKYEIPNRANQYRRHSTISCSGNIAGTSVSDGTGASGNQKYDIEGRVTSLNHQLTLIQEVFSEIDFAMLQKMRRQAELQLLIMAHCASSSVARCCAAYQAVLKRRDASNSLAVTDYNRNPSLWRIEHYSKRIPQAISAIIDTFDAVHIAHQLSEEASKLNDDMPHVQFVP